MKKCILSISLLCGMMFTVGLYAQNATTEVINVEKSYTPDVKSQKKAQLSPVKTASDGKKLPVTYITDTQASQVYSSAQPISALSISQSVVEENTIYPNYIKAGFGYNISTMGQAYYKTDLGKTTLWGKINHDRAQRNEETHYSSKSVYSHTDATIGIHRNIGSYQGGLKLYVNDNAFSNNSLDIDGQGPNTLSYIDKFKNSSFGGQAFIKSLRDGQFFDHLTVNADFFDGNLDHKETAISADARFNIKIRNWKISLDARWAFYDEKHSVVDASAEKDDMMLLSALPQVSYKKGAFDARVGVRIEAIGGSIDGAEFHIMPEAHASVRVVKGLNVYGDFTSGVKMNTLSHLTQINPYLSPYSSPIYTLERIKARVGLTAAVTPKFKLDANVSYIKAEDAPLWLYKPAAAQYLVEGDDVDIATAELSARYDINKSQHISAFAQYTRSTSDILSKASYVPEFRIGASWAGKFVDEKVGVYTRVAYNSSSVLGMFMDIIEVENDGYVEYYGEVSYKLHKRWSVFVNINNTIDGRTPAIYGFEKVGLRALAGIKFNF